MQRPSSVQASVPVQPQSTRRPTKALRQLRAAITPAIETVESRLMLSASITYRPTLSDGRLGSAVVFETGGAVQDFSPQPVSLLQKGFAAPQFDMFLSIDGIPGQSQDAKHKDSIDILAFNWGADATHTSTTGGGGAGAGKSVPHELHFTAAVSKASPKIIEALTAGTHKPSADLTVRSAGKSQADFLKINLDDVLVSSYQVTTATNGTLVEDFTLNFGDADVEYRAQRPDGTLDSPIVAGVTGPAQDFAPEQRSLLQDGFAAPPLGTSYFLDLDGIPGESTDAKHKDAIGVLAFGWGADATLGTLGSGAGVGKSTYHEMHFVSPVSKASPKLMAAMASGTHIPDARFAAVRAGKDQVEFYTITLDNVLVSSYQVKTSPTGQLVEEYTLSFGESDFQFRPQNADGSLGTPIAFHATGIGVQDFGPEQQSLLDAGNLSTGSTDVFLNLDGIPGESADAKHKDAIDVLSFAWGGDLAGTSTTTGGGGAGAGKTTLQTIHVTSRLSKASPLILAKVSSGAHLASAELTFRKSGKDQSEFLTINLDDVLIDSYRVTTAANGTPIEEYTLVFNKADLQYRPQNSDGTLGTPVRFQEDRLGVEHFDAPQSSLLQDGFTTTPSVSYFLDLDGISGESADSKHKDQIGVLAFGWGSETAGSFGTGGGAGAGKNVFHELHFVAPVSKASPKLLGATATGLHIKDAILTAVRNGADQLQFLKVELQDVQVSSYQVVLGANGQFIEEFTLAFDDVKVDYTSQDPTGAPGDTTTVQVADVSIDDFAPEQRSLLDVDNLVKPTSIDGFLSIDGVKGESADAKHKDAIDILSFSWGADATISTLGGGGGSGKSTLQEIHILSRFSGASPSILDLLDTGKHAPTSSLVLRKAGKDQTEFYKINLDDVIISSYQVTTARDGTFLEEYTLSFDKASQEYRPQRADGTLDTPVVFQETGLDVQDFAPAQTSLLQDGFATPVNSNLFLKIDGISGESTDSKHKDEIAIQAFSWGGDATISSLGSGGGAGKTQYHELHFVSRVSKASPRLLDRLVKGQHIKDATLTVRQSSTGNEFLKIKLVDVLISSYQVTTGPDGTIVEEFTLSFGPGGVFGAPTADAGGPYSVGDGQTVTLDASGTGDVDDDPATLTYEWDLDGDGVFGETGADAARGDELGIHPVFSAAGLFGPQTLNISLKVTDPAGHTATDATTITIVDITPPDTTITSGPPTLTNQTSATFTFTGSDQGTPADQLTFSAELDGGTRFAVTSPLTLTGLADGTHTLRLFAKDLAGNEDPTPAVYTWKVDTVGPSALNLLANPKAVSVGATTTLTATVSDLLTGASPIASAAYSLDGVTWLPLSPADGAFDSAQENVTSTIPPLPAGVYTILVRGTDAAGNTGLASALTLPVFDRDAGFITGGGHFNSPAGALTADPSRTGRASLEVSAKYGKTGNQPSGKVSFQFDNLKFDSTALDWLVVTGNKARLAGTGTINGAGDYAFDLTFVDGKLGKGSGGDLFRIRITDRATGRVIYDNGLNLPLTAPPPSVLSGGNLKIHS